MRAEKFRQAAIAYLLVGVLYEGAAWAMWRRGILPTRFGPPGIWLVIGAVVTAAIIWGLWRWQNVWFARVVWVIHAARTPVLIENTFFPLEGQRMPPAFYGVALVVVTVNLWILAHAAWDV